MPVSITMPRLSDTMEEGTLIKWRVKEGDKVASGDMLADVETDKATMELQSFDDGTVAKLALKEGEATKVGELILILATEGESVADAIKAAGNGSTGGSKGKDKAEAKAEAPKEDAEAESKEASKEASAPAAKAAADDNDNDAATAGDGKIRVSPLARKIAEDKGIDLASLKGTGPDGRIIKRDVLGANEGSAAPAAASDAKAAAPKAPAPVPAQPKLEGKLISVSNMRKTIAKRLLESKTTIPHFTVTVQVDMDELAKLRTTLNAQLKAQGVKLSVNDFIVRASALALVQNPVVNSSWTDKGIQQHGSVNIGIAVALPEEKGGGLVVPTLRNTHQMGLRQISKDTRNLATKARDNGLTMEEMSDGTFTISNLGPWNVDHFEAIINPPQAAILAVGAAIEQPVVKNGQIVIGSRMSLTLSADHRVIDGATGAVFVNAIKDLLENPATLLV